MAGPNFTQSGVQLVYDPTDTAQLVGATTSILKGVARLRVRNTNRRAQPPNLGINLTDAFMLFVRRHVATGSTRLVLKGSAILRGI